jgi:phosphosulfolactate synthase (CoM biosynthesis protein A)
MDANLDFILRHEGQQRLIMERLHELITVNPEITGKIRYRIPFYDRKKWVCYMNPIKKNGIELVFIHGHLLSNEQGLLQARGRRQVRGISLYHLEDVPKEAILEILQEAFLVDEELAKPKK